ncbi:uncharacterized protein A4U43_C06F16700 [Asparagus officinalis]|uniref:Uncharacterized protein n=1 Tax=Asparagus officinalis TaxID=4686 RepID=A0A5P1EMY3_ASPOF|nr:uncharacterized protein A4U43_C06F16700 [Asparagus officinalis]
MIIGKETTIWFEDVGICGGHRRREVSVDGLVWIDDGNVKLWSKGNRGHDGGRTASSGCHHKVGVKRRLHYYKAKAKFSDELEDDPGTEGSFA